MHPSPRLTIPTFSPQLVKVATRSPHLFRVSLDVLGRREAHVWTGWADDSSDASRRAVGDARNRWKGYSFVVRNVLQVGI